VAAWRASRSVTILSALLATRAALVLVGVLALSSLSIDGGHALTNCVTQPPAPRPLEMWSRWDAPWYLSIVEHGYGGTRDAHCDMRSTCLPLFPSAIWAARLLLGHSLLAGLVVSNAALVVFLFALWRLVEIDYGREASARAVWLYLLFPSSLFLSGVYAESLMLAATVGALVAARQSKWATAGLLAAAALLSHPVGALVLLPLSIEYLTANGCSLKAMRMRDVAWLLLPATAALVGYFVRTGCSETRWLASRLRRSIEANSAGLDVRSCASGTTAPGGMGTTTRFLMRRSPCWHSARCRLCSDVSV
jgi:Gpi18-like mannosyltransferase